LLVKKKQKQTAYQWKFSHWLVELLWPWLVPKPCHNFKFLSSMFYKQYVCYFWPKTTQPGYLLRTYMSKHCKYLH
jgi:hypothetical protein